MTCDPAGTWTSATTTSADVTSGSDLGGNSQTGAVATGIGQNSQGRFGGGGNAVTRSSLFLSTAAFASTQGGPSPDWNAWVSLDVRGYTGGVGGASYDLVGGVDKLVNADTLVGVLFGYGRINVTDGTTDVSSISAAVGPYFARRFQGGVMDGFLTYARPRYTTTSGNFTSARVSASFTLTSDGIGKAGNIAPYADFRGFRETQPAYGAVAANTIQSMRLSVGVRVSTPAPIMGGLTPYVKLAADIKTATSTANGTDSFTYGRLGAGVTGQFAGGNIIVDLDIGKSRSNSYDRGVKINWDFKF